jgi:hypothetical protein
MDLLQTFESQGTVLPLFSYEPGSAKPAKRPSQRASGMARFEIGQIDLSAVSDEMALTARADRYFGPLTREHIRAGRDRETGDLLRPDWDDPVDVSARFRPNLRLLTDGVDSAFCCSIPEGYGDPDQRLLGLYTPIHGTGPLRASLTIDRDGDVRRMVAYKDQRGHSMPRALTPGSGDRFDPFVQVHTLSAEGGDWEVATALSTPLTLSDKHLRVVARAPMPGEYLVGLVVKDLDGGLTRRYASHVID